MSVPAFGFHIHLADVPTAMTEVLVCIIKLLKPNDIYNNKKTNPTRLVFQESSAHIQTQVRAYCSLVRHKRAVKICILEQEDGEKTVLEDCRAARTVWISGATPSDQGHFSGVPNCFSADSGQANVIES